MFELRMAAPTAESARHAIVFDPAFHDGDALLERVEAGIVAASELNDIAALIQASVTASEALQRYVMDLWDATHAPQRFDVRIEGVEMDRLMLAGASPRGTMALVRAARVVAWLAGREHVVPEDVAAVFQPVMGHRVFFSPLYEMRHAQIADALTTQLLQRVPTPR
jgi:MoxR-like ATPase